MKIFAAVFSALTLQSVNALQCWTCEEKSHADCLTYGVSISRKIRGVQLQTPNIFIHLTFNTLFDSWRDQRVLGKFELKSFPICPASSLPKINLVIPSFSRV